MLSVSKSKLISCFALIVTAKAVSAHTALQTKTIEEGATTYNNIVIGHGCGQEVSDNNPNPKKYPVIAQSVVFPDGDKSIIAVDGEVVENKPLSHYVSWGNKIQAIQSNDVFDKNTVLEKTDATGNVVGFSYRGGKLPYNIHGLIPFRISAITLNPELGQGVERTCANSVTFKIAIADICKITPTSKFNDDAVQFWMPKKDNDNTKFGIDEDRSASLTITRKNNLPDNCNGVGYDVIVTPSGEQLIRDMPIPKYWGNK